MKNVPLVFSLVFLCPSVFANNIIFECKTDNGKNISVSQIGDEYEYTFGTSKKKPELSFRNKSNDVEHITPDDGDYSGSFLYTSLKMKNGIYTYEVYRSVDRTNPDDSDPLSRNESGVSVYKNGKHIATVLCARPKAKQLESPKVYSAGTYRVGSDIPAGEYKVVATSNDKTGILFVSSTANYRESVIHHDIFQNHTYVTVKDGQYLRVSFGEFSLVK